MRHSLFLAQFAIIAVTLVTLWPATRGNLLPWDDVENITINPYIHPPFQMSLKHVWAHPYDGMYIPLTYTTFAAEVALANASPRVIHLDNIILHAVTAMVVFAWLYRLSCAHSCQTKGAIFASLIGALLFAVHPLQVEPVAWATGRKDLLAGFFCMVALWQYTSWRLSTGNATRAFVLALGATVAALLSKPSAVPLPAALFCLDYFLLQVPARKSIRVLWPHFMAAITCAIIAHLSQPLHNYAGQADPLPPSWTAPFVAADSLLFYLRKVLWPAPLSPVYDRNALQVVAGTMTYLALPLVFLILLAAWSRRKQAGGAVLMFVVFLLPVSGIVPFHYQSMSTVADRYGYTSMAAVALLVSSATFYSIRRFGELHTISIAAILIGLLVIVSNHQTRYWSDSLSLWSHAVQCAPGSATVRNNLGMSYSEASRAAEAEKEFLAAITADPAFAHAHNNLGTLYDQTGRPAQAEQEFLTTVKLAPRHTAALRNLAVLYINQQKNTQAEAYARDLLRLDPDNLTAIAVLASTLVDERKTSEALSIVHTAVQHRPSDKQLAQLLKKLESFTEHPDSP